VQGTYEWISRTSNGEADRLSKQFDCQYGLTTRAGERIRQRWGPITVVAAEQIGDTTRSSAMFVCVPKFNDIANAISRAIAAEQPIVLVHPIWPGQVWWPRIAAARDAVDLPPADETISPSSATAETLKLSLWRMRATRIDPRALTQPPSGVPSVTRKRKRSRR
jgi:hypothetical protein